jgi:ankyrin repeat protein
VGDDVAFMTFLRAIARGDRSRVPVLLAAAPQLAGASVGARDECFLDELSHHVYRGDTALHIAAAAHEAALVRELVDAGAIARAANRRGAEPLHYAVDGNPDSPRWDPVAQRQTVIDLVTLGADPNARDKNRTPPLHRAVRNRCAAAVGALLDAGADPRATNGQGSTAMQLAHWTTGRGGSGSPEARAQQAEIVRLLSG